MEPRQHQSGAGISYREVDKDGKTKASKEIANALLQSPNRNTTWDELANKLCAGCAETDIDQIKINNTDMVDRCRALLNYWEARKGEGWDQLLTVLRDVGLNLPANKLQQEFTTSQQAGNGRVHASTQHPGQASISQERLGQHQSAPASNQQSSHETTTGAYSQAIAPEESSAIDQQQLQPGSVSQEQLGQHQSAPASNQQSSHAITTGANSQAIAPEKSSANGQQQLQPGNTGFMTKKESDFTTEIKSDFMLNFNNCENVDYCFTHFTSVMFSVLVEADFFKLRRACIENGNKLGGANLGSSLKKQIGDSKDLRELFDVLCVSPYWNWMNITMLDKMVIASGLSVALKFIRQYKNEIFSRKVKEVLCYIPNFKVSDLHCTQIKEKWDVNFDNLTVENLVEHWSDVEGMFDVETPTILLDNIISGCVEIYWLIPTEFVESIYQSVITKRSLLHKHHILYFEIRDYIINCQEEGVVPEITFKGGQAGTGTTASTSPSRGQTGQQQQTGTGTSTSTSPPSKAKIGKKQKATLQSKDKTDAKKPKDNPSIDKDICANAKKKVMDVYEKLMMINADAILPGLFGKSVITLKDKQTIDAMKLNPEKMKHLIDNIILPRLEANIINKFKEFLEILERSDDIMIKDIAKQIGNSEDFPEMT